MRQSGGRRPRAIACGAALSLVLAAERTQGAEAWYQSYESGVKAAEARQWALAESRLKAALRDGPRPGRRIRAYGVRFIDYLPGYYLGLVYLNQQRYREALDELRRLEASGLVSPGDAEFGRMREMIEHASSRLAALASPAPAAPLPAASPRPAPASPPPPSESQRDADTLLRYARDLLDQGQLQDARKAAESARFRDPAHPGLPALEQAIARREREDQEKADAEALAREREKRVEAQPALVASPPAGPLTEGLEQAGMRAFYAGKYETAASILEPLARGKGRSARALFYLACSNSALAYLKGKAGEPLLAEARRHFAEVRRLDPALTRPSRLISPRITRLFQERSR